VRPESPSLSLTVSYEEPDQIAGGNHITVGLAPRARFWPLRLFIVTRGWRNLPLRLQWGASLDLPPTVDLGFDPLLLRRAR
jgi:hypothetical protein